MAEKKIEIRICGKKTGVRMGEKACKDLCFRSLRNGGGKDFIDPYLSFSNVDINAPDTDGDTLLSIATEHGNLDVVGYLVQKGADCEIKNSVDFTPLHIAAKYGREDIMELFCNLGVPDVDIRNKTNRSPLHYAAERGHIKVAEILIKNEADVNAESHNKVTPLLLAASKGHLDMFLLLIRSGADVNCSAGIDNFTVLHYVICHGWLEIVQLFVNKNLELNNRTSDGDTPLLLAAKLPRIDIINLLIESGANIDCYGIDNYTILHYASRNGWLEIVQSLVNKKCKLNRKTSDGDTAVMLAADYQNKNIVEFLMNSGANVNCSNNKYYTLLHYVSRNGWLKLTESLVNKKCYLNSKTSNGHTPLMLAAICHNEDVVELLIKSGGHVADSDNRKYTLLHYASFGGLVKTVEALVEKNRKLNVKIRDGTPMLLAAHERHKKIVELLLTSEIDMECCDNNKWTVLHHAALNGWFGIVRTLIEKGCNLNSRNANGETPLLIACQRRCLIIIRDLLKAGADCNIKCNHGCSAFNYVVALDTNINKICFFVQYGAYFEREDFVRMHMRPLNCTFSTYVKLCTNGIINKFNNKDLPTFYELPGVNGNVPPITHLKIAKKGNVSNEIEKGVICEVKKNAYCHLLKARPMVLKMLSVKALIDYYHELNLKRSTLNTDNQTESSSKRIRIN